MCVCVRVWVWVCCIVFLHNVQPISHSVNAHRGYLSESSVCITQNSFMKNRFWAQQYNISSSSSSFFLVFFFFCPCILLYSLSQNCVSVWFIKFLISALPPHLLPPPLPPPSSSPALYIHWRVAYHYLMVVLWPAVVPAAPAPQRAWIGMGKGDGELNGQNCEVLWRWQVAPWLTHRLAERTHCVLYSFPLSFSLRKRPNRAQQVNVKKRKRTPLWSVLSESDNGPAHLLYSCIKNLIKVLPVSDWLRMQS